MRSLAFLVAVAGAAVALGGCEAYPAIPQNPAYDIEVRPILMVHCARCHGAGGNLNTATEPTGPDAAVLPSLQSATTAPYMTFFGTDGDKAGAGTDAPTIGAVVHLARNASEAMPPPPAPQLDDWTLGVLTNWAKNPICSNSANPDPSICKYPGAYADWPSSP
ncbi:MAG TPA: hypothetical protein VMT03_11340 [Polyangia bacterium]|nr:hypothetical protein [Polyangia bacterium]